MNRITVVSFLAFILFSVSACRSTKVLKMPEEQQLQLSEEELLKSKIIPTLFNSDFNFQYLTSKAKIKLNRGGKDYALTFNIRMQKDEQIWISINALGGIEVARALLNKDSVRLLDRINKQYIVKDYAFLSEMLNTPIDFYLMQDLMLGNNPKTLDYIHAKLTASDYTYQFTGLKDDYNYELNVRKEDSKLSSINLNDSQNSKKKVEVNYGGYKLIDNINFPFLITSTASSEKESLSLNLEYLKVEKVDKLEFPFNVPKKFD